MKNNYKIRFDGRLNQIDANTFINSLIHQTSIIQEINKELNTGKKIEIKINALSGGSFLVHVELLEKIVEGAKNLFTKDNLDVAEKIKSILVGLLQIKKFLKKEKPKSITKEGDKVRIENNNGNIFIIENLTYNIYNKNGIIQEALAKNFETLENDLAITGFEILSEEETPLVIINREDFKDMSEVSEEIIIDEKSMIETVILHILRLSFEENIKWEFIYKGHKIPAKVKDDEFYKLINQGEQFAKGDALEVELQINQRFDESVNTFINVSYVVNRIIHHIKRNEQQGLF